MKGEILGEHYQIQQQLGKQTGRRTLLVRDMRTQELAVIKLLLFGGDFQWHHLKLFQREAEVLKSLSHPAIPRYLDSFDLDLPKRKGFALVQSYIDAKSLEEQVKAGRRFTEDEVKQLAKSLLEILIYLHSCEPPVIHRDIKPSNILLTNRSGNSVGDIYLVDFGSVQSLAANEGGTITVVGTYGYMPPEQFGGRTVAASDLYGLGATLIYLITGTHPADLPQKDGRIQFEEMANISLDFRDWLKRMVQPYQDKRFTSASQALAVLEQPVTKYVPAKSSQREISKTASHQPAGTKIKLAKNRDYIEIKFKPYRLDLASKCVFVLMFIIVAFSTFIFALGLIEISFFSPELFLGFLIFMLIYIGIASPFILPLFTWQYIRINREIIDSRLALELWRVKFNFNHPIPTQIQQINHVTYIPRRSYHEPPELIISAPSKKYKIGFCGDITSDTEIDWLADELSNWLGLPIRQKHE